MVLFVLYMMGANAKKQYFAEQENLALFTQEAKSLAGLKSKFGDKKVMQRTLKTLMRIAPVGKDFKRSDARVLVFENLSASTLDALLRKIENSTLNIKKLLITRLNDTSATLRLEIKR